LCGRVQEHVPPKLLRQGQKDFVLNSKTGADVLKRARNGMQFSLNAAEGLRFVRRERPERVEQAFLASRVYHHHTITVVILPCPHSWSL
jgi:hypothetical protein